MKRQHQWILAIAAIALLCAACAGDGDKEAARNSAAASSEASSPALADTASAPSAAEAAVQRAAGTTGAAPQSDAKAALTPGQPAPQAPFTDRKLIFNVSLDLVMKDVQDGFTRIGQIAESNGGFVADSSMRQVGDERRGSVTVRVPATRYQDVLGQIRGLAVKVESESGKSSDVTEVYTDLQSRQRNLEATEQQLLVLLGQAKSLQDIFTVQDRLNTTRAEIEKVKGRITLLSRLSDLATITAQLRPEPAVAQPAPKTEHNLAGALQNGWDASLEVVGGVAVVALTALAFSWWLLPFAAIALWLWRRELRRRTSPTAVATDTP